MGVFQDWSLEASGSNLEDRSSSKREVAGEQNWRRAEEVTQGIIAKIQPNTIAEERRRAVIDYVQRLLRGYLRVEVFPFGSVPLKTYLPDGDIDLTAFNSIEEEAFANEVLSVLRSEEQNGAAEFVVKDVQHIRAEVQLVKCIVQNIVVDISFNQLGGLSTLCFLEKVDRLIGKNNLLKRSIILIKAWCYYESRVLGAHHGLISTYALETLILYIFNNFHSSLDGPLAVLYKFLDHYSKFDWDRYCVSLKGPVLVSSLPEIVVETSEKPAEPLLSSDFLRECGEMFSIPSRALGVHARTFLAKNLNIVDPLKESNNLGRSVSRGNLVRIRSAFALGARKLERILSQSDETLGDEVRTFFTSTLDRHGSGLRPDIQDNVLNYGYSTYSVNMPFLYPQPPQQDQYTAMESPSPIALDGRLSFGNPGVGMDTQQSVTSPVPFANPEKFGLSSVNSICERRLSGVASDLSSHRIQTPTEGSSHLDHHLNLSNQDLISGNLEEEDSEDASISLSPGRSSQMAAVFSVEDPSGSTQTCPPPSVEPKNQISQLSPSSEDFVPRSRGLWAPYPAEPTRILPDLDGDYESQLSSLQIGRWFDFAMGIPVAPISPQFVSPFQGKKLWDVVKQPVHQNQEMLSQMSVSAPRGPSRTLFHPRIPQTAPPAASFDIPKPRGTGTYFPNMNHYRDRNPFNWARNHTAPVRPPRYNARSMTFPGTNFRDRRDLQPLQTRERSGSSSSSSSDHQQIEIKAPLGDNGATAPSERDLQFGTYKEPPTSTTESSKHAIEPVYSAESSKSLIAVTNSVEEPVSLPESSKSLIAVSDSLKEPVSSSESSKSLVAVTDSLKEPVSSSESSKSLIAVTDSVEEPVSSSESSKSLIAVTDSVEEPVSSPGSSKSLIAVTDSVKKPVSSSESSKSLIAVTDSLKETVSSPESSKSLIAVTDSVEEPVSSSESSKSLIAVTDSLKEPVSSPESSKSLIAVTDSLKEPVSLPESSRNPVVTNSICSYKESVLSSQSSKNQVAVTNPTAVTTNPTAVTNSFGSYKERLSSTERSKIQTAVTNSLGSYKERLSSAVSSKVKTAVTNPVAVANSIGNSSRQVVQCPSPPGNGADQVRVPVQSYHLKDDDDFPPLSV